MKKTNKIVFFKTQGAGNDFVLIDANRQKILNRKKLVQTICNRHLGIGADGVIFLDAPKNKKHTYKWDFYNKDGSGAEACMNASRCVVLYGSKIAKKKAPITFETRSGIMTGVVLKNNLIELELTQPFKMPILKHVLLGQESVSGYVLHTGVPHFVIIQKNWAPQDWKQIAYEIQKHDIFKPEETNVTFIEILKNNKLNAITFERGVEDYTLACGTGAVAAALTYLALHTATKVEIEMPGGTLSFFYKKNKKFLRGPAQIVYIGEIL